MVLLERRRRCCQGWRRKRRRWIEAGSSSFFLRFRRGHVSRSVLALGFVSRQVGAVYSTSYEILAVIDILCHQRTVGRMTMKTTRRVLGHSLFRSLVRSHRSLTHSGAHGKDVFVYELNASISYNMKPLCRAPERLRHNKGFWRQCGTMIQKCQTWAL